MHLRLHPVLWPPWTDPRRPGQAAPHVQSLHAITPRDDGDRTDQRRRRRPHERYGGRGLRHDRLLRDGRCTGRDGCSPTDQDGTGVSMEPAVECSGSHDHEDEEDRPPAVEEGGGLPSAGPGGEHLPSVQIDHRRWSSRSLPCRASDRGGDRVQRPESDDRSWSAGVVPHRSVSGLSAGTAAGQFRFMHQRPTTLPAAFPRRP